MKKIISFLFLIIQIPSICFAISFGGSEWDSGYSVQQTSDGGYIIAGGTYSVSLTGDVYLIKTDSSGNEIWYKTFGGSEWDSGYSVQQTSDGGYIIAGETNSFDSGTEDVYLIKTDSSGNEIWHKIFGGSEWDAGYSVQQTSDGGYIIAGETYSFGSGAEDVYLIKTDSSGNEIWYKTFNHSENESASSVQQTSDGGYIIAGGTYGDSFSYFADDDIFLIKTDSSGNEVWHKTFGGSEWDTCSSVQQTSDGGYIIAGATESFGSGAEDVYLIKTDSSGNEIWYKTFGDSGGEFASSVQQASDGGYIIAGGTYSFSLAGDVYLIKTDSSGNEIWYKTFGGTEWDAGYFVQQTSDGGYIIAGGTYSFGSGGDVYLIKTDSIGNEQFLDSNATQIPPSAPNLEFSISGTNVEISWDSIADATAYTLYYAPFPYEGEHTISSFDMGNQTVLSVTLWTGAAYYVTSTASNSAGESDFSNVELIQINSTDLTDN